MLKLKLQYFGHLIWRVDLLENTLMLRKIEGRKRRGWQRRGWLGGITDSMDMNLSKLREKEMATHSSILAWRIPETEEPNGLLSMGLHRVRHTEWMTNTFTLHMYIRSPHRGSREREAGEFSISSFSNCFCLISLSIVRHTSHLVGGNFYILWSWKFRELDTGESWLCLLQ